MVSIRDNDIYLSRKLWQVRAERRLASPAILPRTIRIGAPSIAEAVPSRITAMGFILGSLCSSHMVHIVVMPGIPARSGWNAAPVLSAWVGAGAVRVAGKASGR